LGITEKQVNCPSFASRLTAEERLRLAAMSIASFRRLESIYVHNQLGSIDDEMKDGFELSIISTLRGPFGEEWWRTARQTREIWGQFTYFPDAAFVASSISQEIGKLSPFCMPR
jgi:hypothetical protein